MSLKERERRFVEAYMGAAAGNATKAALLAGYSPKTARKQGSRLLTKGHIADAIDERASNDPKVADREEIQRFLSARIRDKEEHPIARLKAADILNKMQGAYVKRVQFENVPAFRLITE